MAGEFNVSLLPWQQQCWNGFERFQVIAAGRRTGKTEYLAYRMLVEALSATAGQTFYVAPTQQQARDIMWDKLLDLGHGVIKHKHINNLQITLVNGQKISLKGSDRPDTMRGNKLNFVGIDEYADIKPETWDIILRPALADLKGKAVFIGTPQGRNHFYDLYQSAYFGEDNSWKSYHFTTKDNPFIDTEELENAKQTMSSFAYRQEFEASFEARGSNHFKDEWILFNEEEPSNGEYLIAVDLAGFEGEGKRIKKKRDNSAIAIVKVGEFKDDYGPYNWWVKDIIHGRWSLDETARKLFSSVEFHAPKSFGIEKGIAQQAVMSPVSDLMRKHGRYFKIEELSHGNQRKTDRILWALEGRFENGLIRLNKGDWNTRFMDELFQFPDSLTNDDTIDALAYIDQLYKESYISDFEFDDFEAIDPYTGY